MMYRFWKAVGEEDEGVGDYHWVLDRIQDEDHPKFGPPIPWSMRPAFERFLHEAYAPAIQQHIFGAERILIPRLT